VIRIEIIDNGPGLDAETGRRAFDAFFTSRAKGTGLGLTIVRQIIGAHSGIVTLENEPVGGARASITLPTRPLQKPDKQADTPVALVAGPGGIAGEARITKADG
jgi:signal transduction histidine kinase